MHGLLRDRARGLRTGAEQEKYIDVVFPTPARA